LPGSVMASTLSSVVICDGEMPRRVWIQSTTFNVGVNTPTGRSYVKPPEATYSERFSERLRAELLQLAVREGKPVGWAELGRRVRERTGREVTDASVNRWGSGSVPDLETIAALAAILGLRAGYLAFGEGPREATPLSAPGEAPVPAAPPAAHGFSEPEVRSKRRKVQEAKKVRGEQSAALEREKAKKRHG
jgi:hypothetical protein